MAKFDCIERPLSRFFDQYGRFVSRAPLLFIIFPLLFTIICSIGFLQLDPLTDAIYLYTPVGAPSKLERQAIHDLWPLTNGSYIPGRSVTQSREVQLTFRTKDNGNILEKPYSEAIYRLDQYIQHRVKVEFEGRTYKYKDLCLAWRNEGCPGAKHIHVISDLFQHGFNVTYPTVRIGSVGGYIGGALGGVTVGYGKNDELILAKAQAWLQVYHLQFYPSNMSYVSGLWEKAFQKALEEYPEDPFIQFTYLHSQSLAEELKRNADSLVPRFILAFTILVIFSVICNMALIDGTFYIDWVLSKPILAVLGVFNAGMGIATAIGALNLAGMPYNDIVGVMPFLVVAVGTDNMFLMVASIRRTNRALPTDIRIGECMSDAAISMFITSLTDAFSFGVGTITSIPAVQIFCVYTCAAIVITFIYQITFFTAWMTIMVEWERKGLHCVFLKPTLPHSYKNITSVTHKLFWLGSHASPDPTNTSINLKESTASYFFQNWFAPILMQPVIRCLSILWFGVYLAIAIFGCLQLREGLEPVNLLVQDSYAIPHYRVLEKYFWHYGATVQIVVNNAPDLRNPEERKMVMSMVHSFANSKHTIGDDSIQFWLKEMNRYYDNELEVKYTDPMFYEAARHYFAAKKNEYWPEDVKWGRMRDGSYGITSFRFLVGLRDIVSTVDQTATTKLMREIAGRYPRYNVTTFMPLWLFTDQYALVVPNTVQNIGIAMIVMIFIALALIPQPMCAIWVALAIASIDVGVIGYMTLWDVNLDAISMITIIMSIGFSVDYSAHITYGYVISKRPTPRERVSDALGALGWPLFQGGISTIMAVGVLATVPAYMILTFFKTVFLAITIGLVHGLIFLPVTLSLFVRGPCAASIDASDSFESDGKHEDFLQLGTVPHNHHIYGHGYDGPASISEVLGHEYATPVVKPRGPG
uniref:SSD domain-containing protein n=1 Tax=Panagrellus redivivus TaxID=6233 RepID=A0A7E4VFC0_PANRE